MPQPSYVHGASDIPLIGETIGVHFDRIVERFGERDALIVRHQQHSLELPRAAARGRRLRRRPRRARPQARRAGRHLVAEQCRMGGHAIRHRQGRADPRQHQPGLSPRRAGIRAQQIGLRRARSPPRASRPATTSRCCATWRPSWRRRRPAICTPRSCPICGSSSPSAPKADASGMMPFADVAGLGGDAERRRLAALAETLQFDEPINIQFTSGTTGFPKGATLTHHNILNNGFFIARAMKFTEHDRLCIPVPLYHCFGMVLGNLACLTHGAAMVYPSEAFEPLAALEAGRGRALHRAARRADDVHRRDGPPRFRANSICRRCAPASWPAARARSRS